jgi:serralysin
MVPAGNVIQPFSATTVTDINSNPLANAALAITGGGTLSGAGLTLVGSGTYTIAAASPADLNTILHGLTFTPPALGGAPSVTSSISLTVADGSFQTTDTGTTIQEVRPTIQHPSNFTVIDETTGQTTETAGDVYTGPVPGLTNDILLVTSDNLNVGSILSAVFIHTGSGTDAIDIRNSTGNSVLDGGTGSNFLSGGSGDDTFFVDDRSATANLWSTVNGFHAGDAATIWGVTPADFNLAWSDNKGAVGYTGLTLDATAPGKPIASLTLVGYSQTDLTNGRLSVAFGTDPGSGSSYMYIQSH